MGAVTVDVELMERTVVALIYMSRGLGEGSFWSNGELQVESTSKLAALLRRRQLEFTRTI